MHQVGHLPELYEDARSEKMYMKKKKKGLSSKAGYFSTVFLHQNYVGICCILYNAILPSPPQGCRAHTSTNVKRQTYKRIQLNPYYFTHQM